MNSVCKLILDLLKVNKVTTTFLDKQSFKKQPSMYCENMEKIIESKMTYLKSEPESEPDSKFAINSVSNVDSDSDSDSDSDFSSGSMNLLIFVFFILYLHSSK